MNKTDYAHAKRLSDQIAKFRPSTKGSVFSPIKAPKIIEKRLYLGKPGTKGDPGSDGEPGKNGKHGNHGKTPVKGVDYFTQSEIDDIKAAILAEIELPEVKDDITPEINDEFVKKIVQRMHALPEKDKLEVSKGIRNASSFIYGGTKYQTSELMHGGGGSGGGSTLAFETPNGLVNDSNVTFTVAHQPLYINLNGSQYTVGTGAYLSYSGGTITLAYPVGTGGFIQSAYNS